MMGAGGFINPGWENFSSDDLMDDDFDALIDETVDLDSQFILFVPPQESEDEDEFDDFQNEETDDDDDDDEDYMLSDSLEDEDFDDDNAIIMSSGDSPELNKYE